MGIMRFTLPLRISAVLAIFSAGGLCLAFSVGLPESQATNAKNTAQEEGKLVYADFETVKDHRPVSNRGGLIQLFSYQENSALQAKFKGLEGANPPAPELVRLRKDDPNRAIAFDYEIPAPNQYAGVTVEVHGQADRDGKPVADDVSGYKYLTLQAYATGVPSLRIEFVSRGQGLNISGGFPQMNFKVIPGFNTYKIPLKSLFQPSWVQERISPKDVLKRLTSVNISAYCEPCTPVKGAVVIDNLVFQN